jgi:hypothetical protein
MRCNSPITLQTEKQVTYCQLQAGHAGEHSTGAARATDRRCQAMIDSIRCGLPLGHFGNHWNQTALRSWGEGFGVR